jgi:23S rRNA pseudouridine955/2504/2580 synthase
MLRLVWEDDFFWYFWKDAWLPSSFWNEKSFLDHFEKDQDPLVHTIFLLQEDFFGKEKEYGLLNRLDTATSGLLYFAKTPLFAERYKILQKNWDLRKIYLADIEGKIIPEKMKNLEWVEIVWNKICITRPIAHHKFQKDQMVVIVWNLEQYQQKIRWDLHHVVTEIEVFYYDDTKNISSIGVKISQGIMHQIRVHLASLWSPIVGDGKYGHGENWELLHLWCVGVEGKS